MGEEEKRDTERKKREGSRWGQQYVENTEEAQQARKQAQRNLPLNNKGYVGKVARLSKEEFENAIRSDKARRPKGSKWRYRLADRRSGSSSAMMLFRVPVGKMFYRGAPRLLASSVNVMPCRPLEDNRIVVEAYPAVVARRFLGRAGYKNDDRRKQTSEQRDARRVLVSGLESAALEHAYGFTVALDDVWRERLV